MSIMLFNPTNEDFSDMMFGGRGLPLPAGQKLKVDDACGRHLLNAYSTRGLCSLEFGDDEATVAEQGRARNREFKERQVSQHNQSNISRRQQGLPYRSPSAVIEKYAAELNIALEKPYTPRKEDDGRMANLEATVATLSRLVETFMNKMLVEEEPAPNKVPPKKEK